MNTAARALSQGTITGTYFKAIVLTKNAIAMLILISAVLMSALAVVYTTDLSRRLFNDLQDLQQARDQLQVESGQLLLEQNTWATQERVQSIAQQQLQMVVPAPNNVIVVKP